MTPAVPRPPERLLQAAELRSVTRPLGAEVGGEIYALAGRGFVIYLYASVEEQVRRTRRDRRRPLLQKGNPGEILEALREARKLPEQANFPEWKKKQLEIYKEVMYKTVRE